MSRSQSGSGSPSNPNAPQPPRASWRGRLVLDLVSVPVAAYRAADRREDEIHFHQLHAACHSRVRHEKVCPLHGPLAPTEIVQGYAFEPDRYVEIHSEELARLRSHQQQLLTLLRFVDSDDVDPIYYDGRAYYLTTEDPDAAQTYAVLHTAIQNKGLYGIGEIVFAGREQWVVVRPWRGLLVMQMLRAASHVREAEWFLGAPVAVSPAAADVAVAEELVTALVDDAFDIRDFDDIYQRKLRSLIAAKLAGEEIVASPQAESQPQVINLTDALRRSVDRARLAHGHMQPPRRVFPRLQPPGS